MRVSLNKRKVTYLDDRAFGFETDNDIVEFTCVVEDEYLPDNGYAFKLDIESKADKSEPFFNTISLKQISEKEVSVTLQAGMFPAGKCHLQIRRIKNKEVYVSDKFEAWVKKPILGYCGAYQPIPSEFYQLEQNINSVNNNPPVPDVSGYWRIWDTDLQEYVLTETPILIQGKEYYAGDGIKISNETISVEPDYVTLAFNQHGQLGIEELDGGEL